MGDRMRIDAEIVHVQSGDINIDSLVTPKHTTGDVKSPSVQIVVDPAAVKGHMDNSEMSKDDITATKSVTFHDNVPAQIESVDHGNDHSHDVTQTHASSNDTMMQQSRRVICIRDVSVDAKCRNLPLLKWQNISAWVRRYRNILPMLVYV